MKKGQVTIFIIVGIILLVITGIILFIQQEDVKQKIPEATKDVPGPLIPMKNYIEQCLFQKSREGIILLGQQGGYIDVPEGYYLDPDGYIPITGDLINPLWNYRGSSRIPSQKGIEFDISNYINKSISGCLGNLDVFKDEFEIEPYKIKQIKTQLDDNGVVVEMSIPITASTKDATYNLNRFVIKLDVPIISMLETGTKLLNEELKQQFISTLVLDLMVLDPQIPFTELSLDCGQKKWKMQNLENRFKRILFYNLPNVVFAKQGDPKENNFIGNQMTWEVLDENLDKEIDISLMYNQQWPLYFNVAPRSGQTLTSSFGRGMGEFMSFLCINAYKFTYDVELPVEAVLFDKTAFGGVGYQFRVAMPVRIASNKPDVRGLSFAVDRSPELEQTYCDDLSDSNSVIKALDKYSYEAINNVDITFQCTSAYYCPLGKTNPGRGFYSLETRLPSFCSPGQIKAENEDYLTTTTVIEDSNIIEVVMTPKAKLKLNPQIFRFENNVKIEERELVEGERIGISITSRKNNDFFYYSIYPDEQIITIPAEDALLEMTFILLDEYDSIIGGWKGNWSVDGDDLVMAKEIIVPMREQYPNPITENSQFKAYSKTESFAEDTKPSLESNHKALENN